MNFAGWMLVNAATVAGVWLLVAGKELWVTPWTPEPELAVGPPLVQPGPSPVLAPRPVLEGTAHTYAWDFTPAHPGLGRPPRHFKLTLPISAERYRQYQQEPREPDVLRWTKYATTPMPELDLLAIELARLHMDAGLGSFDQASNVLCFVQSCVRYEYDWVTHPGYRDWPQYPIESLVERTGDCEDHAILAAAVLKRLGFDVALLTMPGHVALGLAAVADGRSHLFTRDGVSYLYGETTATGWRFGDIPDDVDRARVTVLPVVLAVEAAP